MKKKILPFLYFLCAYGLTLFSQQYTPQSVATSVTQKLVVDGFQNVQAVQEDSTLYLAYENRLYRFEANALLQILRVVVAEPTTTIAQVSIIVLREGIPQVTFTANLKDILTINEKEIDMAAIEKGIVVSNQFPTMERFTEGVKNTGTFKIEAVITPQLKLALGGYPDPVLHQLNINPALNVYLWKGAKIHAGGIIPVTNEIRIEEEKYIRPSILTFQQQVRLPFNVFAKTSVGFFHNDRYGGSIALKKFFFNGNLLLEGKAGYTGYAAFRQYTEQTEVVRQLEYAALNYSDYAIGAKYWLSKLNTRVGAEYGKTLHHKKYVRVELSQKFKETEIGFFAFATQRGKNYGLHIAIPIIPKKYWKPKTASIRPATHFAYTYYTTQNYIQDYQAGLEDYENNLNPDLLKNQLLRLLND